MLRQIHIENIALIERADLDFRDGFLVLTGETGAGKSILIDSINMILGERIAKAGDLVRSGCDKASVTAMFDDLSPEVCACLAEQGIESEDGELLIRRDLNADGKSVCRVNGRQITASMLRELGGLLVNIHGQHDNRALLNPDSHLMYLDRYAKNESILSSYRTVYRTVVDLRRQIRSLQTDEREKQSRIDFLTYQIEELERAELEEGEEETLLQRRTVLQNSEEISSALHLAWESLSAGEPSASELLSHAEGALENAAAYAEDLSELAERLSALCEELSDLNDEVRASMEDMTFDPDELNSIEERLDILYRIKKKYGGSVESAMQMLEDARTELDSITVSEERVAQLHVSLQTAESELADMAAQLTESRRNAARNLESDVIEQLAFLDMPKVRFSVSLEPCDCGDDGADTVEFLLSANPGEPLKPLTKIASGGELSRIMLSMKKVLSDGDAVQTMIFDEIDTGVSGRAAQKIAMKLFEVSHSRQVLVVTHLPQIAAYANQHLLIAKETVGERTFTHITDLDRDGRKRELARMIGGLHITDAGLRAAEEMLDAATTT